MNSVNQRVVQVVSELIRDRGASITNKIALAYILGRRDGVQEAKDIYEADLRTQKKGA